MSINNDETLIYKYIDNNDYESIKKLSTFDHEAVNYAISKDKDDIAKLLVKLGAPIDAINEYTMNSLTYAISLNKTDVAKEILERKDVDVNYSGYNNKFNPLVISLMNKKYDIASLLLDKNINVNQLDKSRNNIISFVIALKDVPSDLVIRILLKTNMHNINIHGSTPLHIMTIHNAWQPYNIILRELDLDANVLNNDNKTAFDYVLDKDKKLFKDMLSANLLYNNKCSKIQACEKLAQQHPTLKKSSYVPSFGTFSPTIINSTMYATFLLEKYPELGVPYQEFNEELYNKDLMVANNSLSNKDDNIASIAKYIKIYTKRMFHIAPYEIMFAYNIYDIHPRVEQSLDKCMKSKKIRFILLKLSILESESNHATILIYDKHKNILEYFDPYGKINHPIEKYVHYFIKTKICKLFKTKNDKCFKFYSKIGLQASSYDNKESQNIGDPAGYCLAWCCYYIEQRINNPDKTIDEIIDNTINNVISKALHPAHNSLLDFIRDYTKWFHDKKIEFYKQADIPKEFVFVKHLPKYQLLKLTTSMRETFMKNIIKRYSS